MIALQMGVDWITRLLGLWLRAQFRSSSCMAAECNRDSVVKSVAALCKQLLLAVIDCYKCPLTEKVHSSVVKLLGGRGSFESLCASVQRPLSWIPPSAVLRLDLFRVPHEPCRRVRRGAGSSLPWAALPSLSESFMVAVFLRVRECMMDRRTLEMKRQWSTFDGEVLLQNLYIIASVRPWTLRMWVSSRHVRKFGAAAQSTHVARMAHWGSGSSVSGRPDNTAVKGYCATSGRIASRCGEAKRRTQLFSKTKDEQRPSGQGLAAWRAWVCMHTSKKCFAESDTISEAAQSCRRHVDIQRPTVMPSAWSSDHRVRLRLSQEQVWT